MNSAFSSHLPNCLSSLQGRKRGYNYAQKLHISTLHAWLAATELNG